MNSCHTSAKTLAFISIFLFLLTFRTVAQTNFPVYSDTTGPGISAHKIVMNADGSFVALGTINEYTPYYFLSSRGFCIAKYTNSGVPVWQKNFEYIVTGHYFYASDVVRAADSGYLVVADSAIVSGMVVAPNFILLIKFDESGNRMWSTYFDDSSSSWGFGHDHRIKMVPGTNEYVVSNYFKMYKFDANGNRIYTNTNPGTLHNFVADTDRRIVVATNGATPALVFADSNFNVISSHPLSTNASYYDVVKTADGHWLALGRKTLANNLYLIYLNKLNADGSQVWERTYNYNVIPEGMSIMEHDSSYYFTGSNKTCLNSDTPSSCKGVSDAIIVKMDTSGHETAHIFESGNILAGDKVNSNFGMQSVFYGDTIFTMGTFSRIGEFGYFSETPETTAYEIWKNAFTAPAQVNAVNAVLQQDILFYPNPANDRINVSCPRFAGQNVSVIIYNLLDQVVYAGSNLYQSTIAVATTLWTPGVYALEITGTGVREQRRIAIIH